MQTSTFGLKFDSLSYDVPLIIRSRYRNINNSSNYLNDMPEQPPTGSSDIMHSHKKEAGGVANTN